jgi:hypothetical protein
MTQTSIDDFIDETATDAEQADETGESEKAPSAPDNPPGQTEFCLSGLRANDPLAFLAAIGVVRSLEKLDTVESPQIAWQNQGSNWTPVLETGSPLTRKRLVRLLYQYLDQDTTELRYTLSDTDPVDKLSNLETQEFRTLFESVETGSETEQVLASYATDAFQGHPDTAEFNTREQGTALTRLNLAEYSGPLGFLKNQRRLISETTIQKLHRTLFELWDFDDDASRCRTMRWSPTDARRGAYTGLDPTNVSKRTMHGANQLAIEGSRLYTVVPKATDSATVGFVRLSDNTQVFQYPLWTSPISASVISTLLTHPAVLSQSPTVERIDGVNKVLRAEIEINDRYRNLGRGVPVG